MARRRRRKGKKQNKGLIGDVGAGARKMYNDGGGLAGWACTLNAMAKMEADKGIGYAVSNFSEGNYQGGILQLEQMGERAQARAKEVAAPFGKLIGLVGVASALGVRIPRVLIGSWQRKLYG